MVEVERFKATDKKDLHKRERYWMETLGAGLNKAIPTRTIKEYQQDNSEKIKEKFKEYHKEWYQENKEHILEHQKDYRENNKDKIKEKNKIYRENNKDKLKEHKDEYRKNNKEKIEQRVSEKYTCVCGSTLRKDALPKHNKSKKHILYLQNLTTN